MRRANDDGLDRLGALCLIGLVTIAAANVLVWLLVLLKIGFRLLWT